MSDPAKNNVLVVQLTAAELRSIVEEAVKSGLRAAPKEDKLLNVGQVCETLNVTEEWVYHNAKRLPFVRKVGGMLRFSSLGLQRYIEATKLKGV